MAIINKIKATDNKEYNIRDDYSIWGGRNLLLNSNFFTGNDQYWEKTLSTSFSEIVFDSDKKWAHIIDSGKAYEGYIQNLWENNSEQIVKEQDNITLSFLAKGKNGGEEIWARIWWLDINGDTVDAYYYDTCILTTTINKYTLTRIAPANAVSLQIAIYSSGSPHSPIEFWFTNVKVEKGNKPTDWSPAPEDIAKFIGNETIELYSE
jgi:hypothetical protein